MHRLPAPARYGDSAERQIWRWSDRARGLTFSVCNASGEGTVMSDTAWIHELYRLLEEGDSDGAAAFFAEDAR